VPANATVSADDIRIEQVLINLLRNACDAMADRDRGRLDIVALARDGGWALRIADTGIGISPEHMPHLFDPFFTTKQKAEGLGLGLAISHGIVRDFGGMLTADNAPGGGAVFEMWLPAQPPGTGGGTMGMDDGNE
jgi:two-component system C4-dicarboxylate transport sensor histidine kinase DctB